MEKNIILILYPETNGKVYVNKTAHCILREKGNMVKYIVIKDSNLKQINSLYPEYGHLDIPIISNYLDLINLVQEKDEIILAYAPPGGKIDKDVYHVVENCLKKGAIIINGMHTFIENENVINIRKQSESKQVATGDIKENIIRLLTVGTDYSIGKMTTTLELYKHLSSFCNVNWIPTGQTGRLLKGDGCVLDSEIIDFVPGLLETTINKISSDIVLIEGQGSIFHPSYSPTSFCLLHASRPQYIVLCHKSGSKVGHMGNKLPSIKDAIFFYENLSKMLGFESKVIGISLNSRDVNYDDYLNEKKEIMLETGLPCFDVIRNDGVNEFINFFRKEVLKYGIIFKNQ